MRHIYFVYILKCADNSYYTGVTNNLERRISEHAEGKDSTAYTYNRRPLSLVYSTQFTEINQAIAFEKQIKNWSGKKKEALISGNWEKLQELAKCNNNTSHINFREV